MIDRHLIRYFLAVVDSGNFSRAAEHMNVAQPTLSVGISKLEKLLDAPLFVRSNRRIHMTEAGSRFLPYARRIESEFNQSIAAVQGVQPVKLLKIGVLNTVATHLVENATRRMLEADPGLRIEFVDGSERELVNRVARQRVDVALTLVARGGDRFEEEVLFEEGYSAALPETHIQAGKDALNADDVADSVMIVRRQCEALSETSRYFTERGVRPFFAYRSAQDDRVMAMVAAGLGMTIVPASHRTKGVWLARMNGFDLCRKVGFIYSGAEAFRELNEITGFKVFKEALQAVPDDFEAN